MDRITSPKVSLHPQNTRKTQSRLNVLQEPMSSEVASEKQASFKKAKDSTIQDPSKDGSSISLANTEISKTHFDAFNPSKASFDQKFDKKSTMSPSTIMPNSLPSLGAKYEEGASRPLAEITRSLPSHGSLPKESKYPQGTTIAEAYSSPLDGQLNSGISIENGNPTE